LAQFALARPFRELNLGYQRRSDPSGHEFVLHLAGQRRFRDFQLHELAVQLSQGLVAEPGANMADVSPSVVSLTARTRAPKKGRVRLGAVYPKVWTPAPMR
jgi:hypothetical protein